MRVFLITFFLFNLTVFNNANAQVINYLDIDNGLSNNGVRCIYQDHKGFMWFGTRDGLNRYDGYGFKVFRNKLNVSNSLVSNSISAMTNDGNNNLWIGTLHGISVYNDLFEKFTTVSYRLSGRGIIRPVKEVIRDIKTDQKGNVLIATEGLGLMYCTKGEAIANQIPLINQGKETTVYGVQAIKSDAHGNVWVFIQNIGLGLLNYKTMQVNLVNTSVSLAVCMEIDGADIWLGTGNGLYRYNTVQHKTYEEPGASNGKLSSNRIVSLAIDKSKNLWIGTYDRGINIYNIPKKEVKPLPGNNDYSPSSGGGAVYSIYIDHESRKWIGTSLSGVKVIDPHKNRFQTVTHEPGNNNSLSANAVSAIYEDKDHKLWIGTESSGLNIWDRKNNSFINYKNTAGAAGSISGNYITSIISDDKNDIWIGTFSDGINRYNRTDHSFKRYKCINPVTKVESIVVFTLYQDKQKNLWAGTLRRGSLLGALYHFNRVTDRFELFDTKLSDLFTLSEDSAGTLWGGNLSQLVKIDKVNKRHQFYTIGYLVRAIYDDGIGHLWIGTEDGGLLLFDRKLKRVIRRYTTEDGLCSNSVLTILNDGKGNLWMSTFNGISKFNIAKRTFKNFYQSDGLQSNQFQLNSALKLSSQEMAFGGIKGFNIFQPSSIVSVDNFPKLLLTRLSIDNAPVEQDQSYVKKTSDDFVSALEVPYGKAVFSFEFTALEYSAPNKISYAYYMEGWDRRWNNSGNVRTAAYTHIDEGSYIFKVKCTNTEGVWSRQEITLRITVLPPWYRTWWAYFLYVCITASLIYIYLLYKGKQTKLQYEVRLVSLEAQRKKAEYETEVAKHEKERSEHEKERVINEKEKELNEKRLSFFTNVSHEFRTPLTLIINPVKDLIEKSHGQFEDNKELTTIHRNAKRMLSLVDQLLLFRKAEAGSDHFNVSRLNFYCLCKDVYLCFTQQAGSKMIQYDLVFENEALEIYADREKLEIILFNLISNALKYTPPGGTITIKATETTEAVLISVSDTGYGIPEDARERLFDRFYQARRKDNLSKPGFGIGLYLAKQFTEAHSGELYYDSELGKGTIFHLKLLKGFKHFPDNITEPVFSSESVLLKEMSTDEFVEVRDSPELNYHTEEHLISDKQSILIVDDESDIRQYIKSVFKSDYIIYEADNGGKGLELAYEKLPDLIITDFRMQGIDGIELCGKIKADPSLSYIPVILLTASSSQEIKLRSMEEGADDYISKPFEKEYLVVRVANLLKNRNNLQSYFYNEITLQSNAIIISEEYKKFLEKCIVIVENHLNDAEFGIQSLADEIGMSHSNLYKRVKSISGQSVNAFIRFIRLRKAAEIMINSDCNVNEVAFETGFNDPKYFGKQFLKLFHLNPSEFIKKHRKSFNKRYKIKELSNPKKD